MGKETSIPYDDEEDTDGSSSLDDDADLAAAADLKIAATKRMEQSCINKDSCKVMIKASFIVRCVLVCL